MAGLKKKSSMGREARTSTMFTKAALGGSGVATIAELGSFGIIALGKLLTVAGKQI